MLTRYLYIETPTNRALKGPHKGKSANNIKLEFKGLSQKKNNTINMILTIRDSVIL